MCELFGLSSQNDFEANEYLKTFYSHSTRHPHGWGLACIARNGALIEKESIPAFQSNYLKERLSQPVEARIPDSEQSLFLLISSASHQSIFLSISV